MRRCINMQRGLCAFLVFERRGSPDNTRELIRIEHIDHNRLGAEGTQNTSLVSGASGADDYVQPSAAAA